MAGRPPKARGPDAADGLSRVEAVERALSLLAAFEADRARLTLKDLSAAAGLYPSTALRLSGSLERTGYLRRDPDGLFRLGPAVVGLARLYSHGFAVESLVRPALARLASDTGETAAFYVREGDRRLCLCRVNAPRQLRSHLEEGSLLPLDRGATGHVLLAFSGSDSPRHLAVRRAGHATSRGERDPDIAAVAVPVFGAEGALAGALGLSGPTSRITEADFLRLAGVLRAEAAALSAALARG
jgi:DNA-binding IclR family transcriptional regulator